MQLKRDHHAQRPCFVQTGAKIGPIANHRSCTQGKKEKSCLCICKSSKQRTSEILKDLYKGTKRNYEKHVPRHHVYLQGQGTNLQKM